MRVSIDITSDSAFDAHVARYGWRYDNHGEYRREDWSWYTGETPEIVLLRQAPNRVAIVRFQGLEPFELWLGSISFSHQFDEVMQAHLGAV